ncbi:hypothetical protein M407DRAFT_23598 [Tulasnella calospora MUT 4182]|uniref:Serine-threonine/tyrosine-protein kinase catalytic domain-containing protein n=1 Tax=Tulasnella calospora MUT 4182 TaxID=1051891 RepID=A0A0C3QJC4_9AGAM|nr:hypothetical protein M407DRAFT_23598 [Tulasnella calospora MUT 4182]
MSGKPPFYKKRPEGAVIAINNDQTPMPNDHPELPEEDPLWILLKSCWDSEPSQRPSVDYIIAEINAEVERRSASSEFAEAPGLEA